MTATTPRPYLRHPTGTAGREVVINLHAPETGWVSVAALERGADTVGAVVVMGDGMTLARQANGGDVLALGVLADWVEDHAGGSVYPTPCMPHDSPGIVAAALRAAADLSQMKADKAGGLDEPRDL